MQTKLKQLPPRLLGRFGCGMEDAMELQEKIASLRDNVAGTVS